MAAVRSLLDLRVSITGGVHFDLVKRVLRDISRSGQAPEEIIQQVQPAPCPTPLRTMCHPALFALPFGKCLSEQPSKVCSEMCWLAASRVSQTRCILASWLSKVAAALELCSR